MSNIDETVHAVTYNPETNSFTYHGIHGVTLWTETAEIEHVIKMRPQTPSLARINHYWKGRDPR